MKNDLLINNKAKLKWACRRGMLELDVLLGNFLAERYDQLSHQEKEVFVELLEQPDPEVFAWIMGHDDPNDLKFQEIVEVIRRHARSRV